MNLKPGIIVLICAVLFVCLTGCEQNLDNALETGSLTVSMSESGAKNISPSNSDLDVFMKIVSGYLSTDPDKTFAVTVPLFRDEVTVENLWLVLGT